MLIKFKLTSSQASILSYILVLGILPIIDVLALYLKESGVNFDDVNGR